MPRNVIQGQMLLKILPHILHRGTNYGVRTLIVSQILPYFCHMSPTNQIGRVDRAHKR